MNALLELTVTLLVIAILLWLAFWVLQQFPPPEPVGRIIRVIVVVLAVVALIYVLLALVAPGFRASL